MPKSKCTKCEFFKENKFTPKGTSTPVVNYSFNVAFEDGTKGVYSAKNKDNPKFKEGEEAEYTTEKKSGTKPDGTPWSFTKIKPVSQFQGGAPVETEEDREHEASVAAMRVTADFIRRSKRDRPMEQDHVKQIHNRFFLWINKGKGSRKELNQRVVALESIVGLIGTDNIPYNLDNTKNIIEEATKLINIL